MKKIIGSLFAVVIGIFVLGVAGVFIAASLATLPGEVETPSGIKRNQAFHLEMEDGTKIAVDLWLPATFNGDERLPTMMYMTRYWRAQDVGPLQRAAIAVGLAGSDNQPFFPAKVFNEAGYAFLLVDARGTGASFGSREAEFSPAEIRDYGQIAEWAAEQSWSNGNVGSVGVSYNGNTAEMLATTGAEPVKAVAPLYNDFDPLAGLVQPGGAINSYLDQWGASVALQDQNDICALMGVTGLQCFLAKYWVPGVKPVDENSAELLKAAVEEHMANIDVAASFSSVEFRDDAISETGLVASDIAPFGHRKEIEASGVPMFIWTGWLDAATTDGALSRYLTFSNPQRLVIGPFSHGGFQDTDPFNEPDKPVAPSSAEQYAEKVAFFDPYLKESVAPVQGKSIRYYTLGEGEWHETTTWPPAGMRDRTFYFGVDNSLSNAPPRDMDGSDQYEVDFEATTGPRNRWFTNMGGGDVIYGNRAEEDKRLLTYTTAPLDADLEVTGSPVITLYVASSSPDTVFHAYLEDVAPDGTVTYITEGVFRAIHRKVSLETPPYAPLGPYHSHKRKDEMPLVPGEVAEISFSLFATSVLFKKGHRVRLALAGADASIFKPWPEGGIAPVWTVHRDPDRASRITLPARTRTATGN